MNILIAFTFCKSKQNSQNKVSSPFHLASHRNIPYYQSHCNHGYMAPKCFGTRVRLLALPLPSPLPFGFTLRRRHLVGKFICEVTFMPCSTHSRRYDLTAFMRKPFRGLLLWVSSFLRVELRLSGLGLPSWWGWSPLPPPLFIFLSLFNSAWQ